MLETITDLLSYSFVIAFIWAGLLALFTWLSSRYNPFVEYWRQWEGSIITGIKLAEKQIPDDTPNRGLAKLDAALRFVLNAYLEAHNGKQPPARIVEEIKQGIQIKHDEIEERLQASGSRRQEKT